MQTAEQELHSIHPDRDLSKQPVIEINHLYKGFGENKVLIDFYLELFKGENVVVLGKSGSGKSVLIKCMVGLLHPESGMVNVLSRSASAIAPSSRRPSQSTCASLAVATRSATAPADPRASAKPRNAGDLVERLILGAIRDSSASVGGPPARLDASRAAPPREE